MNKKNKNSNGGTSKRRPRNLKINTRIMITSLLAILVPAVILATLSPVFVTTVSNYFNFSAVTTNTYSTINQIQWAQTLSGISNELISDSDDEEKLEAVTSFVAPLEKFNSQIYIDCDGKEFYATKNSKNVEERAITKADINDENNLNYFGSDGLVIVNHAQKNENSPRYKIVIINDDYNVNDTTQKMNAKELSNLLLGRTGIIALIIVLLFAVSIIVISLITSQTIVKPIKKIAKGADEIARGNLDYEIDYSSTNELGQTVDSFNDMRRRLKLSIEKQHKDEEERNVLVAGIAHDLRTPLTSAKGYTEGLIDGIADTPEKQRTYLKTIRDSINNTEKILDDLLTISRLQLSSYELNKTDVNAKEFFADGAEEIKQMANAAGFDFSYSDRCNEKTVICIDTDRFARVISNIVSNSIKYAKSDIKGHISMNVDDYERSVIIEIKDNGIGVDKESLNKIFDTMYRADPARSKVSDGSGLGLAVCKQIVELHSGAIWARSREGEGLSIFISLPKKRCKNEQDFDC